MSQQDDEDFMRLAIEKAIKAVSVGEVPVGAVLVSKDQKVISCAYNLCETSFDPTAHAEVIVIRDAAKKLQSVRVTDSTLYVTLEPCSMCMGAIVLARIKRLVFGTCDPKSGAVVSNYNLGNDGKLNHTVEVAEGILSDECARLLKDFFKKFRGFNPILV